MTFIEKPSRSNSRVNNLPTSQGELVAPTDDLIALTGYSAELLKECGIVPQPFGSSYQLVVSDHRSIALRLFESIGVPVVQGDAGEIVRAWDGYFAPSFEGMTEEEMMDEYMRYVAKLVPANRTNER
jgi:hypothetical protein